MTEGMERRRSGLTVPSLLCLSDTQTSERASRTSSAARTTDAFPGAGSVTMTTTAETTLMKTSAVGPLYFCAVDSHKLQTCWIGPPAAACLYAVFTRLRAWVRCCFRLALSSSGAIFTSHIISCLFCISHWPVDVSQR